MQRYSQFSDWLFLGLLFMTSLTRFAAQHLPAVQPAMTTYVLY